MRNAQTVQRYCFMHEPADPQNSSIRDVETEAPTPSYTISVRGLDEEVGRQFADLIGEIVNEAASGWDLSALDGITVTDNYAQALKEFDQGFKSQKPLSATSEKFARGTAMTVHCKRGNDYKCHVFFDLGLIATAFVAEDEESRQSAVYAIFHELAHVHDFKVFSTMMDAQLSSNLESWLFIATNATWSEYIACYLSAKFCPDVLNGYVEIFMAALKEFPESVRTEIIAYRTNADLDKVVNTVSDRIGLLFKFAGYVIGHLQRRGQALQETHPEEWRIIRGADFEMTWNGIEQALLHMHGLYPDWPGVSVYKNLGDVMLLYLETQNLFLKAEGAGFHVNIPFTEATLPPGAWQKLNRQDS